MTAFLLLMGPLISPRKSPDWNCHKDEQVNNDFMAPQPGSDVGTSAVLGIAQDLPESLEASSVRGGSVGSEVSGQALQTLWARMQCGFRLSFIEKALRTLRNRGSLLYP